jgi:hypothetical protein
MITESFRLPLAAYHSSSTRIRGAHVPRDAGERHERRAADGGEARR